MMTQQGHCCTDCCDNPEHDHWHTKEKYISTKANEEFNGS
jgi:hypothetical protein